MCDYIKENLPGIKNVRYWSDGCAGQYKNYKNMMNLCMHKEDFQLDATWSFFATSHGKSPCDGVGGTVKRKIARCSLQRPINDQILTFPAVEKFCAEHLKSIHFISIYKTEMVQIRATLEERYKHGDTISGTRSCHYFEPVSTTTIKAKRLSDDIDYFIPNHTFSTMPAAAEIGRILKPNDYATVLYDGYWWIVLVNEVNEDQKDVTCKFMHPHGPVTENNFHWPRTNDLAWVPFNKFLKKVDAPVCTSNTGRQYKMNDQDFKHTNNVFSKLK